MNDSVCDISRKRRGHSVCSQEEDLVSPVRICVSARVPARALQVLVARTHTKNSSVLTTQHASLLTSAWFTRSTTFTWRCNLSFVFFRMPMSKTSTPCGSAPAQTCWPRGGQTKWSNCGRSGQVNPPEARSLFFCIIADLKDGLWPHCWCHQACWLTEGPWTAARRASPASSLTPWWGSHLSSPVNGALRCFSLVWAFVFLGLQDPRRVLQQGGHAVAAGRLRSKGKGDSPPGVSD